MWFRSLAVGFAVAGLTAVPAAAQFTFNQIAVTGDLAPGVDDGAEFDFFSGNPTLNAAGDVAFEAFLRRGSGPDAGDVSSGNNRNAIFGPAAGAGTPLSVLAREGQAAPGVDDGAEFSFFGSPALNDAGDVAFSAGLRLEDGSGAGNVDTGNNRTAILGPDAGGGAPLSVLARAGQTAPGVHDGAEFDLFSGTPTLNAAGDVAFLASLRTVAGDVDDSNDTGLFAFVDGVLKLIVREGDLVDVVPADGLAEALTVSAINFDNDVFDGSTGFNDAGTLAFGLAFTNGTSGIFTVTVPEPGAGFVLLAALGGVLRPRRVARPA